MRARGAVPRSPRRSQLLSGAHHVFEILVTATGEADEHVGVRAIPQTDVREVGDRMRRLERGDDALGPRQDAERFERLRIGARHVLDATGLVQERMLGPDAWIVEAGGHRVRLADLAVLVLQHVAARAVEHADAAAADRRRVLAALDAEPARLHATQPHLAVLEERAEHADRIRPAADAFETQQRARGSARDPVLAGAGLGDDALLPHPPRQQRLPDRAVDLVRTGVRQVLSFEHHSPKAHEPRESRRVGERRRTPDPLMQEAVELLLEGVISARRFEGSLELRDGRHQRFRQELTAELAIATRSAHRGTADPTGRGAGLLRIAAIAATSGFGSSARMRAVPISTASTRAGRSRASSTVAMPDSATRICHGSAKPCSWRARPMSISDGRRRFRALTPMTPVRSAAARPNAIGP